MRCRIMRQVFTILQCYYAGSHSIVPPALASLPGRRPWPLTPWQSLPAWAPTLAANTMAKPAWAADPGR